MDNFVNDSIGKRYPNFVQSNSYLNGLYKLQDIKPFLSLNVNSDRKLYFKVVLKI